MKTRPLVVITTRLPPLACGIGTYSWLAYQNRPKNFGPGKFLVMEGAAQSRLVLNWNEITDFNGDPQRLARALDRVDSANVLLHYAGRAYQRFGCPTWLPGVLGTWKKKSPSSRLTIFFHELPGRLPIWSRHFVFGKIGERIIRGLSAVADALVTNTANHVVILRELTGRNVHYLPVGSNIAPVTNSSVPRRRTEFVVFGLPFGRLQTLNLFQEEIERWLTEGRLTTLHLIGPGDEKFSPQEDTLINRWARPGVVIRHGLLPESEVASLLGQAGFALTNVTNDTWSKSGAFMACAVTGCTVAIKGERPDAAPLSYAVSPDELGTISESDLVSRTSSLKAWYYENADWKVTGRRLAMLSEQEE
jgi:hypothetical protein